MRTPAPRRRIRAGFERLPADFSLPRHQHVEAYATVLLRGAYEQVSYAGRLRLEVGDVLIQPTFDCHASTIVSKGLDLIRLPWRHEPGFGGIYRGCDIDTLHRVAAADAFEATTLLKAEVAQRTVERPLLDRWADALARALAAQPTLRVADWAEHEGLTRERTSRGFAAAYGVSPVQFRSEVRARTAWMRIVESGEPLAKIAADHGFADQAHMCRAVKALTGGSPSQWRRSHLFKTLAGADTTLLN